MWVCVSWQEQCPNRGNAVAPKIWQKRKPRLGERKRKPKLWERKKRQTRYAQSASTMWLHVVQRGKLPLHSFVPAIGKHCLLWPQISRLRRLVQMSSFVHKRKANNILRVQTKSMLSKRLVGSHATWDFVKAPGRTSLRTDVGYGAHWAKWSFQIIPELPTHPHRPLVKNLEYLGEVDYWPGDWSGDGEIPELYSIVHVKRYGLAITRKYILQPKVQGHLHFTRYICSGATTSVHMKI